MLRRLRTWLVAAALAGALAGCGGGADPGRVEISVTDEGFVPNRIEARAGRPLTLVVTRKSDATCATEIVIISRNLRYELPLNQPVEVTFTPLQPEEIQFACGMNMFTGRIVVR